MTNKVNEDAAGDVLRATAAKHKLKRMEGTKKSSALIAKLTKKVQAGKKHMTEEAVKKATKPAEKAPKIITQNPGYGYHGIADRKHNDHAKAHAEYNKMHAKVKDLAGEAGHLTNSKKPNEMVRDYLDSRRGRHLEGLENDTNYIKKDFGHFSRSYDPKMFVESLEEAHDDYSGVYQHQTRSGAYKNIRIKKHDKDGYHVHLSDNSVLKGNSAMVKKFLERNSVMYVSEEAPLSISEGVKRHNITKHVNVLKKHGYEETENDPDMKRAWHRELVHPKTGHFAIVDAIHHGGTRTEIAHPTKDGEHSFEHADDLHKHLTKMHKEA